ncbi:MAG: Gfo/Idh/MocA family oxidoreductase [Chloroflexota bacterium]|nr:Gfo/Idh/MocA family oxidoreductase [Chloroflexota bacterium]
MRVLQVGLGGFGRGWASLVRETAEVELVGVADADPAAQAWMTSNLGLPATAYFPSLEQALATIACDAVLIVTPPETHRPLAVTALEAGKPVLVEKPLATTLADARTLRRDRGARRPNPDGESKLSLPASRPRRPADRRRGSDWQSRRGHDSLSPRHPDPLPT